MEAACEQVKIRLLGSIEQLLHHLHHRIDFGLNIEKLLTDGTLEQ